jgi:hypothetical protein
MPSGAIRARSHAWASAGLGLAGSLLITLAGPQLAGGPVTWWFHPRLPSGIDVGLFYGGIAALAVAWLTLGRLTSIEQRQVWIVGALWCVPLVAGAPLFSQDAYSYLAQGTLVHLGVDPYSHAPAALAHLGHTRVLHAVAPFWRHTTAPYGPLFLWVVSGIAALAGSNLVLGVLLIRLLDLAGLVLLAVYVPRLARALGANATLATWWVLSPLVLLELVAAAHNDLLMTGLLVAGVTCALEDRPVLGIAVCALAATIKVPAAAGILFIAIAWARSRPYRAEQIRVLAVSAGVAFGVLAAVSLATGLGLGWISSSVFSTPEKVRLAITPATALGWTVAHVLHGVGVVVSARGLESALGVVAFAAILLLGAALAVRTRGENMVRYLGILLIAAAVGGPAAWPWYLSWGLVLLAACPGIQLSRTLAVGIAASVLLVKADGILAFPLNTAPVFAILYVAVAVAVWVSHRRPAVAARGLRPVAES